MAITPTVATNITSTGKRIYNYQQALHDHLVSNPNWTVELATAIDGNKLTAPTVGVGGTGYALDDLLPLTGGTFTDAAVVRVTGVAAGVVTSVSIEQTGQYTVDPTFPAPTSGGNADLTINGPMVPHTVGSMSMVLRSPGLEREVSFINKGTAAVPDLNIVYMGINPDGSGDPIVDPEQPWLDALNFSSSTKALMRESWDITDFSSYGHHNQFLWFEWADCICALNKNVTRTHFPHGFIAGKILEPSMSHLVSVGDVRLDGNGILGGRPAFLYSASLLWWCARGIAQVGSCLRIGTGQTLTTGMQAGWMTNVSPSAAGAAQLQSGAHLLGPAAEAQPLGISISAQTGTGLLHDGAILGIMKYCFGYQYNQAPNVKLASGGEDVFLSVNYLPTPDENSRTFLMPIPDGFVTDP